MKLANAAEARQVDDPGDICLQLRRYPDRQDVSRLAYRFLPCRPPQANLNRTSGSPAFARP